MLGLNQWRSNWMAWVDNVQGPAAKGAPERETKKKKRQRQRRIERGKKKEKKRENESFQIPGWGPPDVSP